MARKRMIDPKFWSDDKIIELEPLSRLCFIGLWNFADDYGIHKFNAKVIKAEIFPADEIPLQEVELILDDLLKYNLIETSEDNTLLRIKGWDIYQKINRPQPSKYAESFKLGEVKQVIKKEEKPVKPVEPVQKPRIKTKPYKDKVDDYFNNIEETFINDLKEAYPNVDIKQELKSMRLWLITNTNKAKKNFDAFVTRWLAKKMESESYKAGPGKNVNVIQQEQSMAESEIKAQKLQKKHDDYIAEATKNAASQDEAKNEINKALDMLRNKRKGKLDALINAENSESK